MNRGEFDGRPFVAGTITGIRSFKVDSLGRLTGVSYPGVWQPGENEATCGVGEPTPPQTLRTAYLGLSSAASHFGSERDHRPGGLHVPCGFWAYFDKGHNPHHKTGQVLGLIEGYGLVTTGSRGFRAEKARIVALIQPKRERLLDRLARRFSGDRWFGYALATLLVAISLAVWAVQVGAWAAFSAIPFVASILLVYLSARRDELGTSESLPDFDAVRRNYPNVPVYPTVKAALAEHPLTTPELPTPDSDPEFWTRAS